MEKYNEYRDKWENFPNHFIQERVPIQLDLEITTYCNLNCVMCVRKDMDITQEHMDLEMAKAIIEEFTSKGGVAIKWCYLGEPMMYPHFIELLKYAKERGIVDNRIATNGHFLTPELSRRLLGAGVDNLILSIDSYKPNVYKQIRVNGNLEKVVKNLHYFKHLRDSMGYDKPTIQVQIIPLEQNQEEIDSGKYKAFFQPLCDIVWYSPWSNTFRKYRAPEERQPKFFCPAPFQRLLVRVNGEIWLCCGTPMKEKLIGRFQEMSIEDAWNSESIKDVREKLNNGNVHLISSCKNCEERYYQE